MPTRAAVVTGVELVGELSHHRIAVSMDRPSHWCNKVLIERPWTAVNCEDFYVKAYETATKYAPGPRGTSTSHGGHVPDMIYFAAPSPVQELCLTYAARIHYRVDRALVVRAAPIDPLVR